MSKKILIIILFLVIFLPGVLRAQDDPVQTGEPCYPDVTQSQDETKPENLAEATSCSYCPNAGATLINVRWDLTNKKTGTDVYCGVSCIKSDSKDCHGGNFKDAQGFLTYVPEANFGAGNLKLKDSIKIKTPQTDSVYRVYCCKKQIAVPGVPQINPCQLPGGGSIGVYSKKIKIKGCNGWGACGKAPTETPIIKACPTFFQNVVTGVSFVQFAMTSPTVCTGKIIGKICNYDIVASSTINLGPITINPWQIADCFVPTPTGILRTIKTSVDTASSVLGVVNTCQRFANPNGSPK